MPDDRNRHSLDRRRAFHVWVAPCDRNSSDRRDGNVDLLLNGRGRVKEFIRQGYEGSVVLRGLLASECDAFEALEFADGLLDVAKQAAAKQATTNAPTAGAAPAVSTCLTKEYLDNGAVWRTPHRTPERVQVTRTSHSKR